MLYVVSESPISNVAKNLFASLSSPLWMHWLLLYLSAWATNLVTYPEGTRIPTFPTDTIPSVVNTAECIVKLLWATASLLYLARTARSWDIQSLEFAVAIDNNE